MDKDWNPLTGRLERSGPRSHNIPMPVTPEGARLRELIRELFVPPSCHLFEMDYADVEKRILANDGIEPNKIYKGPPK